ncbi:hypothetical protein [Coleofasciculus sp. H7-2]|uniref:hypothetical protein n=1 Tax=Coleofasciculus sp. H7-2 TaxID=3351545 RepID=UPI0036715507
MQLKKKKEQKLVTTLSQFNSPTPSNKKLENVTINPDLSNQLKANIFPKKLNNLLVFLGIRILGVMGLGALLTVGVFYAINTVSMDFCGGKMQSEDTTQPR